MPFQLLFHAVDEHDRSRVERVRNTPVLMSPAALSNMPIESSLRTVWSARRQRDRFLPRWHLYTLEPNLANINGNHKHFRNRPAVRPARVRAALGRKMNSIRDD